MKPKKSHIHFRLTFLFLNMIVISLFYFSCKKDQPAPGIVLPNHSAIDSTINFFVQNGSYPFLYARLENKNGSVIYEHSAVNSNILGDQKIDGDSWVRIWSMSKIITISVVLDLIEEGILKFNDPVSKFIPEFKNLEVAVTTEGKPITDFSSKDLDKVCPLKFVPNDSVMTILHLLNHKAGFYYAVTGYECLDSMLAEQNVPTSINTQEMIDRMAKLPLIHHSGSGYFYGTNTTVLGFVAERATKKSLKELVAERVTEPMNIKGLQYGLPTQAKLPPTVSGKDSILRMAHAGELDIFGPNVPDYKPDHELFLGGEGMVATADGYTDFIRMLLNRGELNGHRLLEESTIEDLHSPHTFIDNKYGHNGYNLWVSGDSMRLKGIGDAGLWIGGGYEGTHFWVDPKREFVGVIMTQMFGVPRRGQGRDDKIRGEIYRQLFALEKKINHLKF
jgi:CubicO group peptidase (beta-lactamase class C family)